MAQDEHKFTRYVICGCAHPNNFSDVLKDEYLLDSSFQNKTNDDATNVHKLITEIVGLKRQTSASASKN